jgi:hypothetical protein
LWPKLCRQCVLGAGLWLKVDVQSQEGCDSVGHRKGACASGMQLAQHRLPVAVCGLQICWCCLQWVKIQHARNGCLPACPPPLSAACQDQGVRHRVPCKSTSSLLLSADCDACWCCLQWAEIQHARDSFSFNKCACLPACLHPSPLLQLAKTKASHIESLLQGQLSDIKHETQSACLPACPAACQDQGIRHRVPAAAAVRHEPRMSACLPVCVHLPQLAKTKADFADVATLGDIQHARNCLSLNKCD